MNIKPFIENYYNVLSYIFGEKFCKSILESLNIKINKDIDEQYIKKK